MVITRGVSDFHTYIYNLLGIYPLIYLSMFIKSHIYRLTISYMLSHDIVRIYGWLYVFLITFLGAPAARLA